MTSLARGFQPRDRITQCNAPRRVARNRCRTRCSFVRPFGARTRVVWLSGLKPRAKNVCPIRGITQQFLEGDCCFFLVCQEFRRCTTRCRVGSVSRLQFVLSYERLQRRQQFSCSTSVAFFQKRPFYSYNLLRLIHKQHMCTVGDDVKFAIGCGFGLALHPVCITEIIPDPCNTDYVLWSFLPILPRCADSIFPFRRGNHGEHSFPALAATDCNPLDSA